MIYLQVNRLLSSLYCALLLLQIFALDCDDDIHWRSQADAVSVQVCSYSYAPKSFSLSSLLPTLTLLGDKVSWRWMRILIWENRDSAHLFSGRDQILSIVLWIFWSNRLNECERTVSTIIGHLYRWVGSVLVLWVDSLLNANCNIDFCKQLSAFLNCLFDISSL